MRTMEENETDGTTPRNLRAKKMERQWKDSKSWVQETEKQWLLFILPGTRIGFLQFYKNLHFIGKVLRTKLLVL